MYDDGIQLSPVSWRIRSMQLCSRPLRGDFHAESAPRAPQALAVRNYVVKYRFSPQIRRKELVKTQHIAFAVCSLPTRRSSCAPLLTRARTHSSFNASQRAALGVQASSELFGSVRRCQEAARPSLTLSALADNLRRRLARDRELVQFQRRVDIPAKGALLDLVMMPVGRSLVKSSIRLVVVPRCSPFLLLHNRCHIIVFDLLFEVSTRDQPSVGQRFPLQSLSSRASAEPPSSSPSPPSPPWPLPLPAVTPSQFDIPTLSNSLWTRATRRECTLHAPRRSSQRTSPSNDTTTLISSGCWGWPSASLPCLLQS
jgi:hypothetical protein